VGPVHGGDRLPWVTLDGGSGPADNYAALDGREWQVHIYGTPAAGLAEACSRWGVPLHTFGWQSAMEQAGLTRGALYLVRPDGYVALADPGTSPAPLLEYLDAHLGGAERGGASSYHGAPARNAVAGRRA